MPQTWYARLSAGHRGRKTRPGSAARFVPAVRELEDRAVPATFYVDPNPSPDPGNPGQVLFDAGRPQQASGVLGVTVFTNLTDAINAANANLNAGGVPDVIRVATSITPVFVPSAFDTPVAITDSVNVVGDGAGQSLIQTDPNNDQPTAVLVVVGAGVAANFSAVSFFGGASGFVTTGVNQGDVAPPGSQTGRFIRYTAGTTGTVSDASFSGIYANAYNGIGVAVVGPATTVTVRNTTFSNIGKIGVAAGGGAAVNLFGNTYTGKGAVPFIDYFAEIINGATAVISGNTVTNNQGVDTLGNTSAAVLVSRGGGAAATAQIFGNDFSANVDGIIVGDTAGVDTSTADVQYNNIRDNFVGVGTNRAAPPNVNAPNNWWGDPSGPFNPTTNPAGRGNAVADDVTFAPVRPRPAPVVAAPTLAAYIAAALTPSVTVARVSDASEPNTPGVFRFTRTGVDLDQPLTVSYTVGGTATPGQDYAALSGTVTFPAGQGTGQGTVDVAITPIDDQLFEGTETVLLAPTAGAGYTTNAVAAQLAILDNDAAPVVNVAATANATEPATPGNLRFTRSGDTTQPLTVNYTVGGTAQPGVDYTPLPGSVTFAVGQSVVDVPVVPISRPGFQGTRTVTVSVLAGNAFSSTSPTTTVLILDNVGQNPNLVGYREFAVGADAGGAPVVNFYGPDGTLRFTQVIFSSGFAGGVRVATGDVTGDGVADLVAGTGPGVPTQVRVIDGATGALLTIITPFEASFVGGVFVSAGDLTGDGLADIVVSPDMGGGPRVSVYDGQTYGLVASFFGIQDPNFRGGARTAVGDVNADGRADLVVAAGFLGGPRVSTYDGLTIGGGQTPTTLFNDIFVFEQTLRNGVYVAVGDLNGDGFADIVVGGGPGGGPRVQAISGADLVQGKSDQSQNFVNFFAGNPDNRSGVRIAVKNLDNDNRADLVVGDGPTVGDRVYGYLGKDFAGGTAPNTFAFDAFGGFLGGVFVG